MLLMLSMSGTNVLLLAGGVLFLLILLTRGALHFLRRQDVGSRSSLHRTKHPSAEIFQYRPLFFRLGLVVSLAWAVLALSWTVYEPKDTLQWIEMGDSGEVTIEPPPRTAERKPPPPPPPPKFEAVDDELLPLDTTTFSSMDVNPGDLVAPTSYPKPSAPKYIPPPPPVEVEDEVDLYPFVQEMPVFGDCRDLPTAERTDCSNQAVLAFIGERVRYPALAQETNVQGTAVIRFVVEKDGSMSNLEIVRDPGAGLGEEALRVVEMMTALDRGWTPGRQQGRTVRVQFHIPVRFQLE